MADCIRTEFRDWGSFTAISPETKEGAGDWRARAHETAARYMSIMNNKAVAQAPRGAGCLAGFRIGRLAGRFTGLCLTGLGVGCLLAAAGSASVPVR